jgi:hypothetical protein
MDLLGRFRKPSRSEPDHSWPASVESVDLKKLAKAHRDLLGRYATLLVDSMSLRFFPARGNTATLRKSNRWSGLALRPLVHAFLGSHIDRRLRQLSRFYLYATDLTDPDSELSKWLPKAREELEVRRATIVGWSSWKPLSQLVGVPTLIAAAAALGGLSGDVAAIVVSAIGAVIAYGLIFGGSSFRYKRSMFLGSPSGETSNTYQLEDKVWGLLGIRKQPEPSLDRVLGGIAVAYPGTVTLIAVIAGVEPPIAVIAGIAFIVLAALLITSARSRQFV